MRKFALIAATLLVLTACNTVSGLGRDLQKAGESIEEASKKK